MEETRIVRLADTDATHVLYFTNLLRYAEEAFENLLMEIGFNLHDAILDDHAPLFPIVEAKTKLHGPIYVGDRLALTQVILKVGKSSLQIETIFEKGGVKVGETLITHVMVSKATKKSMPIPDSYRTLLQPFLAHL